MTAPAKDFHSWARIWLHAIRIVAKRCSTRAGSRAASTETPDPKIGRKKRHGTDATVVFSVTYLVVFSLHEVIALEASRRATMRWIQFVFLTASLVSLFVVRTPRAQKKALRALDEFASGSVYGPEETSSGAEETRGFHTGDKNV